MPVKGRPWSRRALGVLGVVAMSVGTLAAVGVTVVRRQLLDPQLYTAGLVEADAYERLYREVLPDPQVAAVTEDLIGGLDLKRIDPATARIFLTAALRWAVPPSTLQQGTEILIGGALAYVRGDTRRVEAAIDLHKVVARVEGVAVRSVRALLARLPDASSTTLDGYRRKLVDAVADLRRGRVPPEVPVPPAGSEPARVVEVVLDATGIEAGSPVGRVVEALALTGNVRDAAITAVTEVVRDHGARAQRRLQDRLENRTRFDPVAALETRGGERRIPVAGELNTVRDVASWFSWPLFAVGVGLIVGGAALRWRFGGNGTRRVYAVAAGLVAAGVVTAGAWVALRHLVDPPLGAATDTGPGTWNLPPALADLTRDVEGHLVASLQAASLRLAAVPVVAGVVLAGVTMLVTAARTARSASALRTRVVVGGLLVALVGVTLVWRSTDAASAGRACNGHPELCDRPYDEVVWAASHNAMSSPDVVYMWPEHDDTMREQLDAGVRALLIDAHYWTDVASTEQLTKLDPRITPAAAEWVRSTAGDRLRGRDGVFLCHNHCVFGGRPLADGLRDVREFLEENPDEVVTLVVQDEVEPRDLVATFEQVGLDRYAYTGRGREWPTLGSMIDAGTRLVVFAENRGSSRGWLRQAFAEMQDTGYGFSRPEEMSCDPNRGPRDAALFMLNHWVSPAAPDRSSATVVNRFDFVVERVRRCEAELGRRVNFIAADFTTNGDVVAAADAWNRVGTRTG